MNKGIVHTEWECYQNNMFGDSPTDNASEITLAFFNNNKRFYKYCILVLTTWNKSKIHHIKFLKVNPVSWLGQCANSYCNGVKEWETRKIWKDIEIEQRKKCNKIAAYAIQRFM